MFNHHYDKVGETYWQYSESEKAFVVKTQRTITKGDPVCSINKFRSVRIMVLNLIIDSYSIMGFLLNLIERILFTLDFD